MARCDGLGLHCSRRGRDNLVYRHYRLRLLPQENKRAQYQQPHKRKQDDPHNLLYQSVFHLSVFILYLFVSNRIDRFDLHRPPGRNEPRQHTAHEQYDRRSDSRPDMYARMKYCRAIAGLSREDTVYQIE